MKAKSLFKFHEIWKLFFWITSHWQFFSLHLGIATENLEIASQALSKATKKFDKMFWYVSFRGAARQIFCFVSTLYCPDLHFSVKSTDGRISLMYMFYNSFPHTHKKVSIIWNNKEPEHQCVCWTGPIKTADSNGASVICWMMSDPNTPNAQKGITTACTFTQRGVI